MNQSLQISMEPERLFAQDLMRQLRGEFEQAMRALTQICSPQGRLDGALVDKWQPTCYELAWAGAELFAAETALAQCAGIGHIDNKLALLFAADTVGSLVQRLESAFVDLGLDPRNLDAIRISKPFWSLRRTVAHAERLAEIGRSVIECDGQIARVALNEDVAMAQESFRRFAQEQVAPLAQEIHRQDLTVPEAILRPLREMGVFGLSIPETYGGSAPANFDNTVMMIAVTEALSEASLAAAGSLITRPEILARALISGGTEEQKAHWLPKIAEGNPLCAIAITEPDFGSDVASISLKATRTEGGWLLNGAKTWCTFAGKAELLMVVARTGNDKAEGYKGLSLMLVQKPSYEEHEFAYVQPDGKGTLSGRAIPTIGYRGMHSCDLSFDNFFVPDDAVIGGEAGLGRGFYFTMAGMVGGRIQTAGRACGVMRAALDAATRYSRDRRVFGAPLADYSLTQAKLARMAARFNACRQLAYSVGKRLDAGGDRMEASLVKLFACRSAEMIAREAMQLHGGMGYAEETPVSRYFVDARVLSIFEGAEETLALKVIMRSLLENSLEKTHA
jgi:(2S)-methylsuccinyl-CoA dehydrogenase